MCIRVKFVFDSKGIAGSPRYGLIFFHKSTSSGLLSLMKHSLFKPIHNTKFNDKGEKKIFNQLIEALKSSK